MFDMCLTYAYRYNNEKIFVNNTNHKFAHHVCSSFQLFIVKRSSNYDNYAVITDVAEVKKNITFNSDTFVHVLRRCNKNDNL